MRIIRYQYEHTVYTGLLEYDRVQPGTIHGCDFQPAARDPHSLEQVELLAPVRPGKIIAVGRNYREHIRELNPGTDVPSEPMLFLKPPSAVVGPGEAIRLPEGIGRIDYEAELALVIGRTMKSVSGEEALSGLLGYTCLNDVSARDLQKRDKQWGRAKGFDTFCPVGPWIETKLNPADVRVRSRLNDEPRQNASTADMIFPVVELLVFISGVMTLEPGDLIATGTPSGVGPLQPGDTVTIDVEGIGELVNPVIGGAL